MRDTGATRNLKWAGIALILAVGLIHLVEIPEYFADAAYLGVLFAANAVLAVVAAVGIARGATGWGWSLGALVAGGAFVAYVVSRTVGLPGLADAEFFDPVGVASLVLEAFYLVACLRALSSHRELATAESD